MPARWSTWAASSPGESPRARITTTALTIASPVTLRRLSTNAEEGNTSTFMKFDVEDISVSTVGPSWGEQVTDKAQRAMLWFFLAITLYITWRLEWKMAVGATAIALLAAGCSGGGSEDTDTTTNSADNTAGSVGANNGSTASDSRDMSRTNSSTSAGADAADAFGRFV